MSKLLLFPQERSPPLRYTTEETHSANQPPGSDSSTSSTSSQQTWSFEEQFKQVIVLRIDELDVTFSLPLVRLFTFYNN